MPPALLRDYVDPTRVLAARSGPDEVHVLINTTVLVKPYSLYYPGIPIEDFVPQYLALTDGSLISSALITDLRRAYFVLMICAAMLLLFLVNIVRCLGFLRTGKIKKKFLLYMVFVSQLLAPICLVPFIFAFVNQGVNCTVAGYLVVLCGAPSLSLLITGVFGIKAYRCLEDCPIVMTVLVALRGGALVVLGLVIPNLETGRRLSGSCSLVVDKQLSFIYIILQLVEGFFICGCFFYAVYKSHGQPSIRGRISLRLSMDHYGTEAPPNDDLEGSVFGDQNAVQDTISIHSDITDPNTSGPRGWWEAYNSLTTPPPPLPQPRPAPLKSRFALWWRSFSFRRGESDLHRKPSLPGDIPLRQPRVHLRDPLTDSNVRHLADGRTSRYMYWRRKLGLSSSSGSTLGRLMPQMLFKAVIRDELLYTTFMATSTVVVAIVSAVGFSIPLELDVNLWILLNWALVSTLIVHSFSRTVTRHEQEALLRRAAMWDTPPTAVRLHQNIQSARSSRQVPSVSFSIVSSSQSHTRRREKDGEVFELE